jgi:hypothetical protein
MTLALSLGPGLSALAQTTYYVSRKGGSDTNSGTSAVAPWKTLAKVSSVTFKPGDKILLDYHNMVLRPKDVIGSPEKCILEMGYGDTIWGRSAGGVTPSGWSCEHGYLQMQGSI